MTRPIVTRRTFLRGVGTTLALPWLECLGTPLTSAAALAAGPTKSAGTSRLPTRMAFVFFPNGAIMSDWQASGDGQDFQVAATLEPLTEVRKELLVIRGLAQHHARANGDGPGDHARNSAAFLTGAQPRKTSGADIKVGISVDQAAAAQVGKATRLPSLELGIDGSRTAGSCDSGYSCAYSSNVSWKTESTPMAKEIHPKLVFERMFGSGNDREEAASRARRELYRKSVLDLVADDANRLRERLGQTDRRKIDEYFASVREIEQRIERAAKQEPQTVPEFDAPAGVPTDFAEHVRLMYDLLAIAFQTDVTRIATFMLANAGSNRTYRAIGVNGAHHQLSHHRNEQAKVDQIKKIDRYLVEQHAGFLKRLAGIREGEGTLLDNCMVLYGSAISDGNRHSHHDLPIVLAGRGGGTIRTGRAIELSQETPLNDLFLSMLDRMGVRQDRLGDGSRRLTAIDA